MIREVTMYRVECDEPACDESPHEEHYAWLQDGVALDEAVNADWTVRPGLHLCPEHAGRTVCMGNDETCARRDVTEADDGWMYCPEHIEEGS